MLKFFIYIPQILESNGTYEDIKGYGFVDEGDALAKAKEYGEILEKQYTVRRLAVFTKSVEAPIYYGEESDEQF
jgi:hypothetical protein